MSRKNTVVHQLLKDQSIASDFTSQPTIVRYLDNCSYQINVTTTDSEGTFLVEVSNDFYCQNEDVRYPTNEGNWVPLTLAGGTPTVSAEDDTIVINLNQLPFYAIRLRYDSVTAGSGTCSVFMVNKEI